MKYKWKKEETPIQRGLPGPQTLQEPSGEHVDNTSELSAQDVEQGLFTGFCSQWSNISLGVLTHLHLKV